MTTVMLLRGEQSAIPFTITDPANGLAGRRVTWSVGRIPNGPRMLRKVGALPGSTADIAITSQTAGAISGFIYVSPTDFLSLLGNSYVASLWVDDGAGNDRCVTAGAFDTLVIADPVARAS